MNASTLPLQLALDDLLGDLRHARRRGDLGRLALLAYCEVRRWARMSGESDLAAHSTALVMHSPHPDRSAFLARMDALITELEEAGHRMPAAPPPGPAATTAHIGH